MTAQTPHKHTPDTLAAEQQRRSLAAGALQQQAIRPEASALVGASAGTGKTYVLTRRFLRILLEDDTCRPEHILAVTFTKAAAAEMRNRVIKELMAWATDSEAVLIKKLTELLEVSPLPAGIIGRARALFPMVLDDGSSLKILTIHSFCQSLLAQFPLEAGLSPHFSIIEGRESDELMYQSIQYMYQTAPLKSSATGWAFDYLVTTAADTTLNDLFKKFLTQRRRFERLLRSHSFESLLDELAIALGLPETPNLAKTTDAELVATLQQHFIETLLPQRQTLKEIYDVLAQSHATDKKVAATLEVFLAATTLQAQIEALPRLHSQLVTKDGTPSKKPFSTKLQNAEPFLFEAFINLQGAFVDHLQHIQSLKVYLKTAAFLTLTHSVFEKYKNLKAQKGVVDFEDLIYYAQGLFSAESNRADWVRFKMDGRINHIMLDEAQDTDHDQWSILRALVEEFFSGNGQYNGTLDRTYFAVGDIKQSIYRFRGAQPHVFGGMADEVGRMAAGVGHKVSPVQLNTSFRSSEVVLGLVDAVFSGGKYRKAVDGTEQPLEHKAFNLGVGGSVELWPLYSAEKPQKPRTTAPEDWHIPSLDTEAADAATLTPREALFTDLAARIRELIDAQPYLGAAKHHLKPADVMVLFRAKTHMPAFVKALAAEGLLATISGEMNLAEDPAVQDLMAVVRFLANPSDTLSLIHGVRSPLFGLTDTELEAWRKATKDGRSYWPALLAMTEEPFAKTAAVLKELLNTVDTATPYQIFLQLLDRTEGRPRLAARYTGSTKGAAADTLNIVIDGFLTAALDYARQQSPSLLGFINWFDKGNLPLKLEASKAAGAVRLMTIHGSKGLESGVVVLPETSNNFFSGTKNEVFLWQTNPKTQEDALMLCKVSGDGEAPLQDHLKKAEREAIFDDEMRLLYVALTRATDHLIIAGIGKNLKADENSYSIIDQQTKALPWVECSATRRRLYREEPVVVQQKKPEKQTEIAAEPLPEWVFKPAPATDAVRQFIVATDDDQQRRAADLHTAAENIYRNGLLLHRLLEVLPFTPAEQRPLKGQSFLNFSAADLSEAQREKLLNAALETINTHQDLFKNAQGEVALAAENIGGRIDLLKVEDDEVTIVDYKTNINPPETIPPVYRKQLQAYSKAASQIWPEKRIKCAILWVNAHPPRLQWLGSLDS